MWNDNKITQRLHIQYPIIQAGMAGGVTTPELVAAVSNAGGLGTLGAGYLSAKDMSNEIEMIKERTVKPFGVNLFIPEHPHVPKKEIQRANQLLEPYRKKLGLKEEPIPEPSNTQFEDQIDVILKQKVPVCSFTFGVPSKEIVQTLKNEGITTIGTATTVEEALHNEEVGVDMVVVQGSEAGGHRGTFLGSFEQSLIGTMALIPQVVDQVQIPVIAAGGIMDGRGIVASFVLGAQGVQMGTAFVTTIESGAKGQHIEGILNTTENQPILTNSFSGKQARGIHNTFIQEMKKYEPFLPAYPVQNTLTKNIRKEAARQNMPEFMSLWCGQAPRLSRKQSVKDLMTKTVTEIEDLIKKKFL